jgi:hypothetical protein
VAVVMGGVIPLMCREGSPPTQPPMRTHNNNSINNSKHNNRHRHSMRVTTVCAYVQAPMVRSIAIEMRQRGRESSGDMAWEEDRTDTLH